MKLATHTITLANKNYWYGLNSGDLGRIAGKNQPASVPQMWWSQNVAVDDYPVAGHPMSYWVAGALLSDPTLRICIDELSAGHKQDVYQFAVDMQEHHPDLCNRVTIYLVNGPGVNYAALNPAIDECIQAGFSFGLEFYHQDRREQYESRQRTNGTKAADNWARTHFNGPGRIPWLNARCKHLGRPLIAFPMFGVIDRFAGTSRAAVWLDRECYNFIHSGWRHLALRYGIGSWVWDEARISTSSRDDAFAQSVWWYSNLQKRSSRLGKL